MAIESLILQDFFGRLNRSGIRYAVLRNYATLPHSLDGSDLDLLISSDMRDEVYAMVKEIAHMHGGYCISCIDDFKITAIIARFCGKDKNSSLWWGLPIDLYFTVGLRRYEYFDTQIVLNDSIKHNGIKVASPDDAAITAFLKECLANGKSRKNYENEASLAYAANKLKYKKYLKNTLGKVLPIFGLGIWLIRVMQKILKKYRKLPAAFCPSEHFYVRQYMPCVMN